MRDVQKAGKLFKSIKSCPTIAMTIPDNLNSFMERYGSPVDGVVNWNKNTSIVAIIVELNVLFPRYYGKKPMGFKRNNPPYFHETLNMFEEIEFIDGLFELIDSKGYVIKSIQEIIPEKLLQLKLINEREFKLLKGITQVENSEQMIFFANINNRVFKDTFSKDYLKLIDEFEKLILKNSNFEKQ